MRLIINGEPREAPELATVADLARWLALPAFGSAVELNGQVVRKADHAAHDLQDGDGSRWCAWWAAADLTP